jgi:hypothetical protein
MKSTFFDKGGTQVDESIACDTNGTIRDGYTARTRVTMMDSAQQMMDAANRALRDPFKPLTDDEKIADIDARNAKLSDAWRHATPLQDTQRVVPAQAGDDATMDAIYDRHDKHLENAWRTPA